MEGFWKGRIRLNQLGNGKVDAEGGEDQGRDMCSREEDAGHA